jgi:transposase-like protein
MRSRRKTGKLDENVEHRQVKFLNNRLEADHGALKRLINPTRVFKTLPTASATIKGFEVMRMIHKGHCLMLEPRMTGQARFVSRLFRHAA